MLLVITIASISGLAQDKVYDDSIINLIENTSYYWNRKVVDTTNNMDIKNLEASYNLIKDDNLKAIASKNIGDYYLSIQSYQFSETYLLKSIELFKKLKDWEQVLQAQKSLICAYRLSNQIYKLKNTINTSLVYAKTKKVDENILIPIMELAIYNSYDTHNYEEGIVWGQRFKDTVKKYSDLGVNSEVFNYNKETETRIINIELAKCYIKTGRNLDSVVPFLKDAYNHFFKTYDYEKLSRICKEYVNYYFLINDIEMANTYMQKYFYYTEQQDDQELVRLGELPEYIKSTTLLKNKLNLSKLKNKQLKKTNQIITVSVIIISILIIIASIFFIAYKKNKQKLIKQVNSMQRLINADLHDNFGTNLAAISTAGSILKELLKQEKYKDDKTLYSFMDSIDKRLSAIQIDIKDIIWANNPDNNKLFKIKDRIEFLAEQFKLLNNFDVNLESAINKNKKTPSLWNRQLILIVKEAMHNAYKHSKAKGMTIKISEKRDNFLLTCEDNGVGFNINQLKRKSGILNMQKRSDSINCALSIKSSPNGTRIKLFGKIPT